MSKITTSTDTTVNFQGAVFPRVEYVQSVFTTHSLKAHGLAIRKVRDPQPDWMLGILVAGAIILAWVQVFYHKRMQQIFRAPFSRRFINQLMRDGNLFSERITVALGGTYLLAFSLFLYECNELLLHFSFPPLTGFYLYLSISVVMLGLLTLKIVVVQFLGVIFKTKETTSNYLLNLFIFALLSGPVLLIALVFIVYLQSPAIVYASLVLLGAIMIFRFLRGFFIGMALTKFSYLFLFVYLCSLEILPLLVIIKIILNIANTTGA